MPSATIDPDKFLAAPVGRLVLANALPMMLVMMMGALLNVIDAVFLGHFVGPVALAAVTIVFPAVMVLTALAALVGGGMASLFARSLGAGDREQAGAIFSSAHGLCLALGAVTLATVFGADRLLDGQSHRLDEAAGLARDYLLILVLGAPVQFLVALHADAARSEGRAGAMALLSVCVTVANMALNYLLIVMLGLGVAGSAWGTVSAQLVGLLILLALRRRDGGMLPLHTLAMHRWTGRWREILALGLPLSLSFFGMALVAGLVVAAIGWEHAPRESQTIAAYGIVTRILGFAFMPQMALALATQVVVATNAGAGLRARVRAALSTALLLALGYCGLLETLLITWSGTLGFAFVDDVSLVVRVGTIIRPMIALYVLSGPVLSLAMYFQALGSPGKSAALMLLKPYVLMPVLIMGLASLSSEDAMWLAFPFADAVVASLSAGLLLREWNSPREMLA